MKNQSKTSDQAFTLLELLIVIVIIVILVSLLLPPLGKGHHGHSRIKCVNNLKQVATGMRVWASGHNDKYPWELFRRYQILFRDPNNTDAKYALGNWNGFGPSVTAGRGGPPGFNSRIARSWTYFGVLSNELGNPKVLTCPNNKLKRKSIASDWSTSTYGFWNTTGQKNGDSPVERSQKSLYGKVPGYDGSVSYSIVRNPVDLVARGWNSRPLLAPWCRGITTLVTALAERFRVIQTSIRSKAVRSGAGTMPTPNITTPARV